MSYKYLGLFASVAENGLHPKHRLTGYHAFFVNNIIPNELVLDVGCGNGALSFDIACKARFVIGIDWSDSCIADAKKKFKKENLQFIIGDVTKARFSDKFDVIVLSNVLEHISDRKGLLVSLGRLSDNFLIRVPQLDRSWEVLYKKEIGLDYRLDNDHKTEYTYEQLEKELNAVGIRIVRCYFKFGEFWVVARK